MPYCSFCHNPFAPKEENDLLYNWWHCIPCNSYVEISLNNEVQNIILYTNINNSLYYLEMSFINNYSSIIQCPQNINKTITHIISFPFILSTFNPQNIKNKIINILNFL